MKIKYFIAGAAMMLTVQVQAQEGKQLTLEYCQGQAVAYYPATRQYALLQESSDLELKNLGKNWLPTMNINGQASYQSDVTKVPTIIPQFSPEPISKDWYKLYLDVSQVIWDGGSVRQGKAVQTVDHEIDVRNLELELYQVKEQVNNLFFSILLLQENRNLLETHVEEISSQLKDIESAVRNGVVLSSNADILKAEKLKVEQKIEEISLSIDAALKSMAILMGEEIPMGSTLLMPEPEINLSSTPDQRLEFGLFTMQQSKMETLKKVSNTSLLPKFQAFGQAGYGRPAFDMLNNDFTDYYIVGVRLNWNFWNWNKTKNEKAILSLNQQIIDSKRDAFSQNLSIDMQNKRSDILKYEQIILKDQEILDLRTRVVKEYESRLKNGVITATEFMTELNSESEARLNINIHKIQLVQAKYRFLAAIGQL